MPHRDDADRVRQHDDGRERRRTSAASVWFAGEWTDTPILRRASLRSRRHAAQAPRSSSSSTRPRSSSPATRPSSTRTATSSSPSASALRMTIDPVTLSVVHNSLVMVASEMDLAQEKTSFSPIISEAMDRANGIYAAHNGELIVQGARGLPLFVGVMQATVGHVIERQTRAARMKPGDVIIINDPYLGGTHLMDVRLVKPFFRRRQGVGVARELRALGRHRRLGRGRLLERHVGSAPGRPAPAAHSHRARRKARRGPARADPRELPRAAGARRRLQGADGGAARRRAPAERAARPLRRETSWMP